MLVMALPDDTQLHRFQLPDSRNASLGGGRAILSLYGSRELDAAAGDRVRLKTPTGTATLTVAGVTEESLGD